MKSLLLTLLEREKICGICGESLEKEIAELKVFYATPGGTKPVRRRKNINIDIDHIHPKSKGGLTELFNLQVTHRSCNGKKGSDLRLKENE